jgi:hypothetical protein
MTKRSFRSSEIQFNNLPLVSNLQPRRLSSRRPRGSALRPPDTFKVQNRVFTWKGSLDLVGLLEDIALKRYGNFKMKFNCQKCIFKIKNLKCE